MLRPPPFIDTPPAPAIACRGSVLPARHPHMHDNLTPKNTILDAKQMARIIRRMAGEIVEMEKDISDLLLVGIRTRGVPLAEKLAAETDRTEGHKGPGGSLDSTLHRRGRPPPGKLAAEIDRMEGHKVPVGILDIPLYRDDLSTIAAQPQVKGTHLPLPIDERLVILRDDVPPTGR